MRVKRIITSMLAAAIALSASVCSITAGASDLTNGNYSTGKGGVKAYTSNVDFTDGTSGQLTTEQGSGGTTARSSARATVPDGKTVKTEKILINCRDSSMDALDSDAKYVHSTFRFNSTASFYIYIRTADGTSKKWVLFEVQSQSAGGDGSGGVYRTSTSNGATSYPGATWNVTTDVNNPVDNTVHMILNTTTGAGYCFVNGKLGAYMANTQKTGAWYGYEIRTAPDLDNNLHWTEGASFQWKYNIDKNVGYTWYQDTEQHTVAIEDIFDQYNVLNTATGDPHFIFRNDDPWSYAGDANGATVTFPSGQYKDSIRIQHDYYNAEAGYAQYCLYFFGNDGYRSENLVGGDLLYMSYTQKIDNATRAEVRIKAGDTVDGKNRFTFTPIDGSMHVNGFSGTGKTLNKAWGDAVNVGILVDRSGHKVYSFVDGIQLGGAYDFSGLGDFKDLRIYLNGTADDSVADITLSNWVLKQYDTSKDADEFIAENAGMSVYFPESGNVLEFEAEQFGMSATGKTVWNAGDISNAQMFVAVYNSNGNLIGVDTWDYVDGATNADVVFDRTGQENEIRLFCWSANELQPLSQVKVFKAADYVE